MFNKENIIVFAAGGGNDVFSAIAYIESFLAKYNFKKIAIVSVLGFTPFHSNDEIKPNFLNIELPLIKPSNKLHRYIPISPPKEISNTEKMLESIIPDNYQYICMSPKYSSIDQAQNLRKLFIEWDMLPESTQLNIVDFGGDILTNGLQSSIISPELDAYTLSVVRQLCMGNSAYTGNISVCFPGIDGELNSTYLSDYCKNKSIFVCNFDKNIMYNKLVKIYSSLINTRPGNTIPNMIKILEIITNEGLMTIQTNKHWIINKEKVSIQINTSIDLSLQSNIYIFDLEIDNPFSDLFNQEPYDLLNIIQSIVSIYKLQDISDETIQSSDFFLQYLRKDNDGYFTNKHLIYSDDKSEQDIMFVDIYPYIIKNKQNNKSHYLTFTEYKV